MNKQKKMELWTNIVLVIDTILLILILVLSMMGDKPAEEPADRYVAPSAIYRDRGF